MLSKSRRNTGLMLLAGLAAAIARPGPAAAAEAQQLLVDKARIVAQQFLADPDYARMRVYVQNAYGVLVVPQLLRGGFIVGGQYGQGVLLARDPQSGLWSEPAFFTIYGGSFGLQLGGQTMDIMFTIMNQSAIQKLLAARFQLGADASGALGPIGAGVGAGTTVRFGEDVYVFSRNKGLFGGLAIDGTVVVPDQAATTGYYGRPYTAEQIVEQRAAPQQPGTQQLRDVLSQF